MTARIARQASTIRDNAGTYNKARFRKLLSTTALAVSVAVLPAQAAFALDDLATPTGEQVVGGAASFDRPSDGILNIHQGTDRVVINWDSFNIGGNATTEFFQPGSDSLAVNRVTGRNADPTQILGTLKANGKVMVLDRNGVIFGKDAVIDVGGIVASTGDVNDDAVMRGDRSFELSNFGDGEIINNGTVTVAEAGLAAFVGPTVINNGVINARLGKVALSTGGERATVDLYGDGLVEIALDSQKTNALVKNAGVINAEGGTVALSASAAKEAVDEVINMDGVIKVSSVEVKGGKIILSGGKSGTVKVSGTMDASGKNGGGAIDVSGQNVHVADTAVLNVNAIGNGDGGEVKVIAEDHTDFRGNVYGRGGDEGGNGGFAEISGYGILGYTGFANLGALNGTAGTLLLDPTFAVIYNGFINTNLGSGYVIGSQNLANSMENSNVIVQADNFIDVGTKKTAYTGLGAVVNAALNALPDNDINLSTFFYINGVSPFIHTGTTQGSLQLQSAIVNFNRNLTMGNGSVNVVAPTVNLDARLYASNGTTELGDARLGSTASTVNVISNAARIQQGIELAASGATVNVGNGNYTENVSVNKQLKLFSVNGRDLTTITGISNVGALGAVTIGNNVNDVELGDIGHGFKIVGIDNGIPGIETAAVYLQGSHDGLVIQGNNVVAKGDEALVTEYGSTNSDMTIDNNIFSGKTYTGVAGTGDQFVDPNVPRQLVALNNGLSNITFTNNTITGDSGEQHLVAIESAGGTVSGNTFTGTTTAANLRIRGNLEVVGNTITGTGADTGIRISGDGTKVYENTIHGVQTGILAGTGVGATIKGNIIYNTNGDGIKLDGSQNTTTLKNYIGYSDAGVTSAGDDNIKGYGIYDYLATGTLAIQANKIIDTTQHGIFTQWGTGTLNISDNAVKSVDGSGIYLEGSTIAQTIEHNFIDDAGQDGIHLWNTNAAQVKLNEINGTGGDGIDVHQSQGTNIAANTVKNTTGFGILAHESTPYGGLTIDNNVVNFTGDDGIHVENIVVNPGNTINIINNKVGLLGLLGDIKGDGIEINDVDNAKIKGNQVNGTGATPNELNGIMVVNSTGVVVGGATNAERNVVTNVAGDGIKVKNSDQTLVENNKVDGADRIGVYTEFATNTTIKNNILNNTNRLNTSDYGSIYTYSGSDFTITGNNIDNTLANGMLIYQAGGTNLIQNNQVDNVDRAGIRVEGTSNLTVNNNKIGKDGGNVDGDGLYVIGSNGAQITNNKIEGVGGNGAFVANSNNVTIDSNNVKASAFAGLKLELSDSSFITANTVDNADTGIKLVDVTNTTVGGSIANANTIKNINAGYGHNGIDIRDGGNLEISYNDLKNIGGNGIYADTSVGLATDALDIAHNTITNVDYDGIHLFKRVGANVTDNTVNGTTYGDGVSLEVAENTNIIGNTIKNIAHDGIKLWYGNSGTTIKGNTINAKNDGIFSDQAGGQTNDNLTIGGTGIGESNDIHGDKKGININGGTGDSIVANVIHGGDTGIQLTNVTDTTVGGSLAEGNTIKNTNAGYGHAGINIRDGGNIEISYNTLKNIGGTGINADTSVGSNSNILDIENNKITDVEYDGINLTKRIGANIVDNTINGTTYGDGVNLQLAENTNVIGNTIKNIARNGVNLWYGNHGTVIQGNTIRANNTGVNLEQAGGQTNDFVTIGGTGLNEANDIHDGKNGVVIDGGEGTTVIGNIIEGQSDDGVSATATDDLTIASNKITGGKTGIRLVDVTNSTVGGTTAADANTIKDILLGWTNSGINILRGTNLSITHNVLKNVGGQGIYADASYGNPVTTLDISNNKITDTEHNAIYVKNRNGADITDNKIDGTTYGSGIVLELSEGVDVLDNNVKNVKSNGIDLVYGASNANIRRNEIVDAGANGIATNDSDDLTIRNNTVTSAGLAGISITDSNSTEVTKNQIDGGKTGIKLDAVTNSVVGGSNADANTIENIELGWNNSGINIFGGENLEISHNMLNNIGGQGIYADGAFGAPATVLNIASNDLTNIEHNAIYLKKRNGADIVDNTIIGTTYGTGIVLELSENADVLGNTVRNAADNGIALLYGAHNALIQGNTVRNAGQDGIAVQTVGGQANNNITIDNNRVIGGTNGVTIAGGESQDVINNIIRNQSNDGIHIANVQGIASRVNDNVLTGQGSDGIDVQNTRNLDIRRNDIDGAAGNGIFVRGGSRNIDIINNDIGLNAAVGGDGIKIRNVRNLTIERNEILAAGDNGIQLQNTRNVDLTDNLITNSGAAGLFVSGPNNGSIVLTANQITSLAGNTGAVFESGEIDLTAAAPNANIFTGGSVGMRFATFNGTADLSLVGDTLGETVFDLQSGNYVELANGAFFLPGSPTVIDATHATFDGFRPDTVQFLTLAQYNFLESKLFHYNDDQTLGLFFFGLLPDISQEDILNGINAFGVNGRGLNITIRGLPRLPGQGGGNTAFDLANISPAAGNASGNAASDYANIEPAAGEGEQGQQGNNVASIEPAAGGESQQTEQTSCWSDAAAGAANGVTVNYSFGEGIENALSDAAGCQGGN